MSAPAKTEAMRAIEWWNKANKVGTPVRYRNDGGKYTEHTTSSEAFLSPAGPAVVRLKGLGEGYVLLKRCTAVK